MASTQDILFTVLPFGQSTVTGTDGEQQHYLNFSVLVSPRLGSTATTATLAQYPDWAGIPATATAPGRSWPDTVVALLPTVRLLLPAVQDAPRYPVAPIGAHRPDPARFAAVFPAQTPVTPYAYRGFQDRIIRSAPVAGTVDTIAALYGRFGLASPTAYPAYADLVAANAFGPIGFEQENTPLPTTGRPPGPGISGNGPSRKAALQAALERVLASSRALPQDLRPIAASLHAQFPDIPQAALVTSLAFLQYQRFLQRDLAPSNDLSPALPPPELDFHQMVAATQSLPTLMRVLGLVLDLRAGPVPDAVMALWQHGLRTPVQLVVPKDSFLLSTNTVAPRTMALLGPGVFRPAPQDQAASDVVERMLRLGDSGRYQVVRVDPDNAVVKAMQFADTVTRSRRQGAKLTSSTPDRYPLPALRTGGFAIARSGRAPQMADTLAHQTADLQAGYFGDGSVAPPPLYEEDLTRGYRLDVLDVADGVWRSLMWRQGSVTVDGSDPIAVLEEDTVVPAPTTAPRSGAPDDLYLQETLTRWDGWSLAVPRLGRSFDGSGTGSSEPAQSSSGFKVITVWQVPGSSTGGGAETTDGNAGRLPRLRFGRSYRLRARAADLAGNSLPVAAAPTADAVVSAAQRHLRFEPVFAPRLLLVAPPLPGDSEEVVVIRSESGSTDGGAALDNGTAIRLVVPSPTSVALAEQHGGFDLGGTGRPMNQQAYAALAARTAVTLDADGTLVDPDRPHGTANPYIYPAFLPINYLPEVLGRIALVRNLPVNADKQTVAQLPFDTSGKGWPRLQGCRIVLSRGSTGWKTRTVTDPSDPSVVTTELDLTLATGDMVTALVNAHVDEAAANIMAVWEWIRQWAAATGQNPDPARQAILAGTHWMVTPWRRVRFVHAVRTPLAAPQLFLRPTKTAIGQTNAAFPGTTTAAAGSVLMNRKSTARIDVDGSWTMPIDTGSNADPVTPQEFRGHAFTIELARDGRGVDPTALGGSVVRVPNAENVAAIHEFGDTKFRAVTYRGTATSYYVEYFREQLTLPLGDHPVTALRSAPVTPGVAFEGGTVELTLTWTEDGRPRSRRLVAAPPGTSVTTGAPTPGDYVVVEDPDLATDPAHATKGTVQILAHSAVSDAGLADATVVFSSVGPTIHTYSDPAADKTVRLTVPNAARPDAPHVRYIVPIYHRTTTATGATRTGGAVRVYLERPWWSSGDGERLGVVCWHPGSGAGPLPPKDLAPYVTLWGFDPIFQSSRALPGQPTPACFPLATASSSNHSLTIEEGTRAVDVAGHPVGYDTDRKLWYCDIRVTGPDGKELASYMPFVRFALARYQPHSIPDAHLSKVVLADYAQLAPGRAVTVTGSGSTRTVTVAGYGPTATDGDRHPSRMVVLIEQRDTRIADDALAWQPVTDSIGLTNPVELSASISGNDHITWHGTIRLPRGDTARQPLRLTFEEYERIPGGAGGGRLVFTESLPLR